MMTNLPNPMFDLDLTKLIAEFKVPGVEMDTILATQRKNIDALTKANQLAIEGLQTVARRQAEILRGGFEDATALMREIFQTQSADDRVVRQTEAAKVTVERALANARELAEIVTKAGNEAFDVIHKRLGESLDEVRDAAAKRSAAKK
jgi:phasin family protein